MFNRLGWIPANSSFALPFCSCFCFFLLLSLAILARSSASFSFFSLILVLRALDFPPPPALSNNQLRKKRKERERRKKYVREFNINLPRRTLAIVKGRVVIQFQTCLHAIKLLKLDKAKATACGGFVLVGCDAHGDGVDFGEVGGDGFDAGGEWEVSCIYQYFF